MDGSKRGKARVLCRELELRCAAAALCNALQVPKELALPLFARHKVRAGALTTLAFSKTAFSRVAEASAFGPSTPSESGQCTGDFALRVLSLFRLLSGAMRVPS